MKKYSRILAIFLALVLLLAMTTSAMAADTTSTAATTVTFTDVAKDTAQGQAIYKMVEAGYVKGDGDGRFRPNDPLTRAELVTLVNQVFHYTTVADRVAFSDINQAQWFYQPVRIAQAAGYIAGYPDNTFRPNANITREEVCSILNKIMKFEVLPYDGVVADPISPWAEEAVKTLLSNRIFVLEANNTFRATAAITRAEVCEALAKFITTSPPTVTGNEDNNSENQDENTNNDTNTDETNKDSVTSSGGGGGSSSGGSGNSNTDTDTPSQDEIIKAMKDAIYSLEADVISRLSTDEQVEIVNDIIYNMRAYIDNTKFDYESAIQTVKAKYNLLPEVQKEELKDVVTGNVPTVVLLTLEDYFLG